MHTPSLSNNWGTLPFLALCLLLTPLAAHAQRGKSTHELTSDDGRFTVMVPAGFGTPVLSTQEVDTDVGTLDMHMYLSQTPTQDKAVMLAYIDYPPSVMKDADVRAMLDSGQAGAFRNMRNATLLKQRDVRIDGYLGRSVEFSMSQRRKLVHGRIDFVIVNSRLYQIFYAAEGDEMPTDAVASFFDSFKLLTRASFPRRPFASKAESFTIDFPAGFPKPKADDDHDEESRIYTADFDNRMAQVSVFTLSSADAKRPADTTLREQQSYVLRGSGDGMVESESSITRDGNPGRSFRYFTSTSDGGAYYARCDLYLVKNRVYWVLYVTMDESELDSEETRHFFDSFKVTRKKR